MSGTVNISRDIWRDVAFKGEPFTEREAFMWIIMDASYKPREKRVGSVTVSLERGQLVASVRFMAEAWQWSKSRVDRYLDRLEKRDMIGTSSGTGVNVITVCKYEQYQNKPKDSGTPKYEKRDSSGTAAGQQRDKPNKGSIPDAIQKQETPKAPKGAVCVSFSEFWLKCENKVGEVKAERIWRKLDSSQQEAAHENVSGWFGWFGEKYPTAATPNVSTYLSDKRWTDGGYQPTAPPSAEERQRRSSEDGDIIAQMKSRIGKVSGS